MTQEQFAAISWGAGMFAEYDGVKYPVQAVCFREALIGLGDAVVGTDEPMWVRCENAKLIEA